MNTYYRSSFLETTSSSLFISSVKKSSSISTSIGVAPEDSIAETVATAVWETVITSSPIPIFNALNEISIASVPLATPIEKFAPIYSANSFSNEFTSLPSIKFLLDKTFRTAFSISFL